MEQARFTSAKRQVALLLESFSGFPPFFQGATVLSQKSGNQKG
jgi:hypothetical protein